MVKLFKNINKNMIIQNIKLDLSVYFLIKILYYTLLFFRVIIIF